MAIKARYHKSCLIALYNRLRLACSKSLSDLEDDILCGVVVREVVEHIRESISSSENVTPVYKLRDLQTLSSRRLAEYNASKESIDRIHRTRLKEDILKELPDVSETRHGKDVLLTPSKDVGAAIFDACTFISQNDGAGIIRKQLFSDHLQSDDFLENFEENTTVPPSLLCLISMILGHSTLENEVHGKTNKAAVAISQLIVSMQ